MKIDNKTGRFIEDWERETKPCEYDNLLAFLSIVFILWINACAIKSSDIVGLFLWASFAIFLFAKWYKYCKACK